MRIYRYRSVVNDIRLNNGGEITGKRFATMNHLNIPLLIHRSRAYRTPPCHLHYLTYQINISIYHLITMPA